jgi:hypothetical protein
MLKYQLMHCLSAPTAKRSAPVDMAICAVHPPLLKLHVEDSQRAF